MTLKDIPHHRLQLQQISHTKFENPADVVRWLGAVQAQDYLGALWAVGIRTKNSIEADVEQALADRTILRTWPLRGTLHFVTAEDAHWMLETFTPRIVAMQANRLKREFELDEKIFTRCKKVFERTLQGGKQLTRDALYDALEVARIPAANQRGLHILWRLAQDGFICFGTRKGKQQTFTLLDEWVSPTKKIPREEAIAKLAKRYFNSHSPATIQDFAWWSGLTAAEAKLAVELVNPKLLGEKIGGQQYFMPSGFPALRKNRSDIYLLPGYDEYVISYKNRSASLEIENHEKMTNTTNGIFFPIIVINSKVAGTWKRSFKKELVAIETKAFSSFSASQKNGIAKAGKRYAKFVGKKLVI